MADDSPVENRLISMQTFPNHCPSVPLVFCRFDYDYMSRRVGKTVHQWISNDWQEVSASAFLYDGWNLVAEQTHEQTNTQTNFFTWGLDLSGSLQGAGGVGGLLAAIHGTNSVCYTFDGNGNVSEVLDVGAGTPSSRILAHYEYSPFGETIVATGDLAKRNPFRFSTKYTDDETTLVYYGYRYYSPELGRWINRDPIEEWGGINLYHFVFNNTLFWIDYLGLGCTGDDLLDNSAVRQAIRDAWDKSVLKREKIPYVPAWFALRTIQPMREVGFHVIIDQETGDISIGDFIVSPYKNSMPLEIYVDPPNTAAGVHTHPMSGSPRPSGRTSTGGTSGWYGDSDLAKDRNRPEYMIGRNKVGKINPDGTYEEFDRSKLERDCVPDPCK